MDNDKYNDDKYLEFVRDAKEYVKLQSDLLRLNLVEKISQIISYLAVVLIGLFLGLAAFMYFSMAFVFWLQPFFSGSLIPGFLIVGGIFVLLLVAFFSLRKRLLINPIIRKMSRILFEDSSEKEVGNE